MRQRLHLPHDLDGRVWRYANLASANRRHTHAELELNLVTRGLGVYLIGKRRYQIRRGDLLWLFPGREHLLIEQTTDFRMWIAVFRRRAIRRVATEPSTLMLLKSDFASEPCRRVTEHDLDGLETLLAEVASLNEPGFVNAGIAYALARSWHSFQNASEVPVRDLHPAVERASHLMRDGGASLPLRRIAHKAGLSPARLSRLFHQQTGFTVVQFRNRQRLERFFAVYGSGQRRTMLDAALEAGFGSYAQFHRVFTEVMGCPPRNYRHRETI